MLGLTVWSSQNSVERRCSRRGYTKYIRTVGKESGDGGAHRAVRQGANLRMHPCPQQLQGNIVKAIGAVCPYKRPSFLGTFLASMCCICIDHGSLPRRETHRVVERGRPNVGCLVGVGSAGEQRGHQLRATRQGRHVQRASGSVVPCMRVRAGQKKNSRHINLRDGNAGKKKKN